MSAVDERTEPRWTMKGNVLPDRDFFIEALREEGRNRRRRAAIRETCEALSTALHAIPFFLFLLFVFPRSRVSLDHYVLFYVPTSCSTYLLQSGTSCRRVDARIIWGTELTLLPNHFTTFCYWLLTTYCLLWTGIYYFQSLPPSIHFF